MIFSFVLLLLCVVLSEGEFATKYEFRKNKKIFNPTKIELNKSEFNGKFKETFHDIKISRNDNELQRDTMDKSKILRNEMMDQIEQSRFEIGNPKQIAKDLSWIQVDKYGNQNEFDLNENDINNLINHIQNEMHSHKFNNIHYKMDNEYVNERRRTYVFDPDDRIPIDYPDHSPPMHVGLIKFRTVDDIKNNRNGDYYSKWLDFGSWYSSTNNRRKKSWQQCTGTLIGPRHVLTAGHCVHEGNGGDWYGDFRFYLSSDISDGNDRYYGWHDIRAISCWTNQGDFNCDFGLIILDREPGVGYMQIGYNNDITNNMWFVAFGYPTRTDSQLWLTGCFLWEINDDNLRDTQCDIEPGQSGSALSTWIEYLNTRIIYAIISNENYIQTSNGWYSNKVYFNQYTRITPFVYTVLCDWILKDGYDDVCEYYY